MRNVLLLFLLVGISFDTLAQEGAPKCGYASVREDIINTYGTAAWQEMQEAQSKSQPAAKTTVAGKDTIPVVFHIILTQFQLNALGKEAGIIKLIDSQLRVLNRDFNAMNKDSAQIPPPFKPLYGNAGITFALAHTAPDGSSTPGYEIITTTRTGFNLDGSEGSASGFGFSDAKYKSTGGADAWDHSTYLNIWLFNALENSKATNILGLTVAPWLTFGSHGLPKREMGIILNYKIWVGNFAGRTLTHEMGHYFGLRHVWGDDDGDCPNNGGADDGIEDTPPQSRETYGCPTYPKFDACTKSGTGIMFMNYMDYTDDNCQRLFTLGQVARMKMETAANAASYSLTQHPAVLLYPNISTENEPVIYPNPARSYINIHFPRTTTDLQAIRIVNSVGQVIVLDEPAQQKGFYSYNLEVGKGIYFVHLQFANRTEIKKIELQ